MPLDPSISIAATPFPTANTVLNLARQRINDLLSTPVGAPAPVQDPALAFTQVGGSQLLDVSTPANSQVTQVIFQSAYSKYVRYLETLGHRIFIGDNLILTGLPTNTNPDPAAQSYVSWTEFFDGQYYWPRPVLPPDFRAPLKIRERISGSNRPFQHMVTQIDGIENGWVRGILNRKWEWRENKLYLLGANGLTDLNLRYIKGVPPIMAIGNTPWYYLPIEITDCENALSYFIAAEVASARGPEFVADIMAMAEAAADQDFNRQARADQRVNVRRIPRGSNGRHFYYGI